MRSVVQDVRFALRTLRRNPGVTGVVILSLAIGIGPNAAIFSVIDAIGFRPLAIRDPARLVRLDTVDAAHRRGTTSYPDFRDIRTNATQLSAVAAWVMNVAGMTGGDHPPEIVTVTAVSEGFFSIVGVPAAAGRLFRADESSDATAAPVVLLSDDFWRRRFGRSPDAINSTFQMNNESFTIVGVLPATFRGLDELFVPDIWVPLGAAPGAQRPPAARDTRTVHVIGRLRETATLAQAQAELDARSAHLAAADPGSNANRKIVVSFEESARRRRLVPVSLVLLIVPLFVLLIACANVAGLLIGRAGARSNEVAVRVALGAGRGRLIRQFLTESTVLALAAGALASLTGYWIIRLLPALIPILPMRLGLDFRMDSRVMLFTLGVVLIAVPVFGLAPALASSKPDILPLLKGGVMDRGRFRRLTFRNALTVGQIAGSLVLLLVSGLLVRSFLNSSRTDLGFVQRPMIISSIAPGVVGYNQANSVQFLRQFIERLSALPSVESAALARHMPLNGLFGGGAMQTVRFPGRDEPDGAPLRIRYNAVDERYFSTMGIRLTRGRTFTAADRWPGTGAILVNETMAARFWPGEDPVGRWIELVDRPRPERRRCQVVGVIQDGKYLSLGEERIPYLYVPFEQQPPGEAVVIVRTRGPEQVAADDFRRVLRALDPSMPALPIITLREHLHTALMFERVSAMLAGTLATLALILSTVGLYGVISYLTASRTREIGVRMALGAERRDVLRHVIGQGGAFATVGIAIGLAVGALVARLMSSVLYGVSTYDPATYGAACLLVMTVALAATYFPARRAAGIDPIEALRSA
jgi:putative ABC transport system permease protein